MKRLKIIAAALLLTTALTEPAAAFPLGFLGGLLSSFGVITPLIGIGSIGVVNAGFTVGAFLASGFGQLLLSAGLSAVQYFVNRRRAPSMDSARINVRVEEADRWILGGRMRSGGAAYFGEYDDEGAWWQVISHGDSELVGIADPANWTVYLSDIPVTLDENNRVTTDEFCLTDKGDPYNGSGTKVPYFTVWLVTFTPDNPVPPQIAEFIAKFPEWTSDHKMAGQTYSVMKIDPIKLEKSHNVFRWRGVFGIGEPSISVLGHWDRCYDPRDGTQDINDRTTWAGSSNAVIRWAWWRTHPMGRAKPMSSIDWDRIAEQADICDQIVLDKNGNEHPRYAAGIAVADTTERGAAEAELMLACDGQMMTSDEGKTWVRAGYYEAPTITFSATRDIFAMEGGEADDGEMATDGVVVRYIEPSHNYQPTPSAPWINPNYTPDPTRAPRYIPVDILACQSHNQAVRLAKAIGLRSQATQRIAPITGLRALIAAEERIVNVDYDTIYQGQYEIVTPIEEDEYGVTCSVGLVPVDENRWDLLEGEEGDKPAQLITAERDPNLELPTNVVVTAEPVPGSGGAAVRLVAGFDAPARLDYFFQFQYRKVGETAWRNFIQVDMDDLVAYSDIIDDGSVYEVQYRTVTGSGRASDWVDPPVEVAAIADTIAPAALGSFALTGGVLHLGHAPLSFATTNDEHLKKIALYRVPAGDVLDKDLHFVKRLYGIPLGTTFAHVDGDATVTNMLSNPNFDSDTIWSKGAGWTIVSGKATKTAGVNAGIEQTLSLTDGKLYRSRHRILDYSAGAVTARIFGSTFVQSAARSADGYYLDSLTANATSTGFGFNGNSVFAGAVDDAVLFEETAACAPQGEWDYYAIPENGSGVEGPQSGPLNITII